MSSSIAVQAVGPQAEVPVCYGDRARRRLAIAARLLRFAVAHGEVADDRLCATVLHRIRSMSEQRQDELRSLVDWVEDYEAHEATLGSRRAR